MAFDTKRKRKAKTKQDEQHRIHQIPADEPRCLIMHQIPADEPRCLLNKGNNKITELRTIYKGKVKTHKYIHRQNQSTTGKL